MPYRVIKGTGPNPWKIQKKEGERWTTVGSSATKDLAKSSVRARQAAEHGFKFSK